MFEIRLVGRLISTTTSMPPAKGRRSGQSVLDAQGRAAGRLQVKQGDVLRRCRILDDFFKVDEAQVSSEPYDGTTTPSVRRLVFERSESAAAAVYHRLTRSVLTRMAYILSLWRSGPPAPRPAHRWLL